MLQQHHPRWQRTRPGKVAGKIVICDRGINARIDKSQAVSEAGGVGMVLANASDAQSLNADFHIIPTSHVGAADGSAIKAYATTPGRPRRRPSRRVTPPRCGGRRWRASPSFGPALAGGGDLLKPDITAPGVDVVAAVAPPGNSGNNFDAYSGTSMAAPHITGIAALILQAHPGWSPMWVKSALMTTASPLDNKGLPIQRGGRTRRRWTTATAMSRRPRPSTRAWSTTTAQSTGCGTAAAPGSSSGSRTRRTARRTAPSTRAT